MDFIEDIEDILAVELSKNANNYSSWEDAKKRLKEKGIIDYDVRSNHQPDCRKATGIHSKTYSGVSCQLS